MTPTEKVQQEVREYLQTPASFPLVSGDMMNTLIRRAFVAKERRFTGESITGFDQLQQEQK